MSLYCTWPNYLRRILILSLLVLSLTYHIYFHFVHDSTVHSTCNFTFTPLSLHILSLLSNFSRYVPSLLSRVVEHFMLLYLSTFSLFFVSPLSFLLYFPNIISLYFITFLHCFLSPIYFLSPLSPSNICNLLSLHPPSQIHFSFHFLSLHSATFSLHFLKFCPSATF